MTLAANREDDAPLKLMICAVEPSGDAIGAALMEALKEKAPTIQFFGCGGAAMAAQGLKSLFPITPFSVIGPVGALQALPAALSGARILSKVAALEKVYAAVMIDGWAFSRIAAENIRKVSPDTKLIKYVAPQVWASRPQRARIVAKLFDSVLTIFQFENAFFEKEDVQVNFVGSSLFQEAARKRGNGGAFRERFDIGDAPLLAVLPGSRHAEVRRLSGPFHETVERITLAKPNLRLVISVAPAVEQEVRQVTADWPGDPIYVSAEDRYGAFAAATAALAASGTVTTELAINETPMVIGYRVDWVSALWIRSVITIAYASLLNIAAEREVIPEFLQENCKVEAMAAALAPLLEETPARAAQLAAFPALLEKLGVGGAPAASLAADAVLEMARS